MFDRERGHPVRNIAQAMKNASASLDINLIEAFFRAIALKADRMSAFRQFLRREILPNFAPFINPRKLGEVYDSFIAFAVFRGIFL
ncbi:MAG: hypothetical protein M3Q99_04795 [Acidobacteriota bacterium]|nr:hypothetical protein [Acidobacteriota bacterium]